MFRQCKEFKKFEQSFPLSFKSTPVKIRCSTREHCFNNGSENL